MKTETMLSRVEEILASTSAEMFKDRLFKLEKELIKDVQTEFAKKDGRVSALTTINKLLRDCKRNEPARKLLHYADTDSNGRQYVADLYRIFRLNKPLKLEPRPEGLDRLIDMVDKHFPNDLSKYSIAQLPDAARLKELITLNKARLGKEYIHTRYNLTRDVCIDAQYLLDLMSVFPDVTEVYYINSVSPIYAVSANGDAIICPIRVKED